ncbi:hypothetical protein CDZ96_00215 [Mameliella alba]|nr:hypothetical protein CDZ96_00215 [Mameliella alba]
MQAARLFGAEHGFAVDGDRAFVPGQAFLPVEREQPRVARPAQGRRLVIAVAHGPLVWQRALGCGRRVNGRCCAESRREKQGETVHLRD